MLSELIRTDCLKLGENRVEVELTDVLLTIDNGPLSRGPAPAVYLAQGVGVSFELEKHTL